MSGRQLTERAFIASLRAMLPGGGAGLVMGVGDDCAVIRRAGRALELLTTDTMVEGIHFDRAWHQPLLLGRKLAAVNLSDVAAMGGTPRFAVLSVAVPVDLMGDWLEEVMAGVGEMLAEHRTLLVGGDTVRCPDRAVFTLTLVGEVSEDDICYRSGARPGDTVWLSGEPGRAAAGLALCRQGQRLVEPAWAELISAHLNPVPMVRLGGLLAAAGAVSAMIDTSDGLATDLAHLCGESGVGAEIDAGLVLISARQREAARHCGVDPLQWALAGGEDFLLLFTVPAGRREAVENIARVEGLIDMRCVGRIIAGEGVFLLDGDRREDISYRGYDHFGNNA